MQAAARPGLRFFFRNSGAMVFRGVGRRAEIPHLRRRRLCGLRRGRGQVPRSAATTYQRSCPLSGPRRMRRSKENRTVRASVSDAVRSGGFVLSLSGAEAFPTTLGTWSVGGRPWSAPPLRRDRLKAGLQHGIRAIARSVLRDTVRGFRRCRGGVRPSGRGRLL